ncbi:MAG TPA: phosphoadenylyl-sulfate reductase [Usitatibacter sp.]|nr:phosphoadenylyl-sulfate reductase [Usitatibacter sp.]
MLPVRLQARTNRAAGLLVRIQNTHVRPALASSFGAEDMVLIDLIAREGFRIEVFTLDTGRLPRETLDLLAETRSRYGLDVQVYTPSPADVDAYVAGHGLDGFYASVEARKACCEVRKVEPLRRALQGRTAWITGLRRAQNSTRAGVSESDYDAVHGLAKFNPLADWTDIDVWTYLRNFGVPYNALHDRGYPSIGCEPCTRAVKPGEHPRAGRWWWENEGIDKECGMHHQPQIETVNPENNS